MPGVNDLTPGLYISDDRWKADGPFIKGTAIVPNARYAIFEGGDVKPDVMKSRVRIPGSQR
ncbi:MAG: hypothetical protein GW780_05265, partial [Candidatus Aenigmarchaeota archaeon]|nr:hypothetical protein [Candidatus Aenigmarchaeota archaeon]